MSQNEEKKSLSPEPPSGIKIHGHWFVTLYGPDGSIKDSREGKNVICTNGKEALTAFLNSCATAATTFTFRYIGVGSGGSAESSSDTTLGTELSRHTGVVSNNSSAVFEVRATFAAGSGTGAITEYGLFNTNTAGAMFSRDLESVINKGASDTLTVTTRITFA